MDLSAGMLAAASDLAGCLAQADLRAIPIATAHLMESGAQPRCSMSQTATPIRYYES